VAAAADHPHHKLLDQLAEIQFLMLLVPEQQLDVLLQMAVAVADLALVALVALRLRAAVVVVVGQLTTLHILVVRAPLVLVDKVMLVVVDTLVLVVVVYMVLLVVVEVRVQ
jgi:hypothetical protein